MSFVNISSKIISESINTALYVDDKVLLPFEETNSAYINQSRLFNSFAENNCLIDFKRYDANKNFDVEKSLYNKDLLILDWHLNSNESDLTATFDILEKAINTQSLHFAVVYTNQRQADLTEKVILNVASYFSGLVKGVAQNCEQQFVEFIDATGLSKEDQTYVKENIRRLSVEIFFQLSDVNKAKNLINELSELLIKYKIEQKKFVAFLNSQSLPRTKYIEQVICLGFILNHCEIPNTELANYSISLPSNRFTIRIGNLYIKVFSKDITDSELYKEFTKSLTEESNIFLTLLGLEIRNRFRETSGFIGKDLDEINQLAFFFHRKTHFDGNEELFNEFLKDIWKDQVASFLLEKDIELFSVIDEFKESKGVEGLLEKFTSSDDSSKRAIAKLNLVYNRLSIKRKPNDEIRFGDIFSVDLGDSKMIYLLCLTPHCDCLRPGKIKNMFFFVEGTDIGISKGVMKSDGDFVSFIQSPTDGRPTCLDWTNGTDDCKPFSFHIPNNKMTGDEKNIRLTYFGKEVNAVYVCTLKENYAQRISNKAFSYPLRVGIDFATFKKLD